MPWRALHDARCMAASEDAVLGGKHVCTDKRLVRLASGLIAADCRKCDNCLKKRRYYWHGRLYAEFMEHSKSCVLTLTYAKAPDRYDYRDIQLWMKRVRSVFPSLRIKYYVTGERGEKKGRVHWHVLLFGISLDDFKILPRLRLPGDTVQWPHGLIFADYCTPASIGYVTKYLTKSDGFSRMSQGLGFAHLRRLVYRRLVHIDSLVYRAGRQYFPIRDTLRRYIRRFFPVCGLSKSGWSRLTCLSAGFFTRGYYALRKEYFSRKSRLRDVDAPLPPTRRFDVDAALRADASREADARTDIRRGHLEDDAGELGINSFSDLDFYLNRSYFVSYAWPYDVPIG